MRIRALRQRDHELRGEIARVAKERAAIGDAIVAAKREMTDDERAKFVALGQEKDRLEQQLAANAELLRAAEEADAADRNYRGDTTDADTQAATRAATTAGIQVHDRTADDPMRGFRAPREFLSCVMDAGARGRIDARLRPLTVQAAAGSDEAGTYADPYGGFLVPVGMAPSILTVEAEADPVSALVRRVPLNSPSVSFNARVDKNHTSSVSGGLTVSRRIETGTVSATRMEFEQVWLRAHGLFGLAYATEELLTDSPESFIAVLEAGFRDEFAAKLFDERLNGTGAGEFEGVLTSPALISVAKETGQAADTINKTNIDKMVSRCWRYNRATWCANHDTFPQLASIVQEVGTGGAPVQYFQWTAGGQATLLGRPLHFTEFAPKLGDLGDILLVMWSEYLEGTYQQPGQAESIHVRFTNHERAFKFWVRNDGRGWWRSALTPRKSSQTLSPFVALAAR